MQDELRPTAPPPRRMRIASIIALSLIALVVLAGALVVLAVEGY